MATYSFQDVNAAITGAGGACNLGQGAGTAEEGITIEAVEDKSTMTIGADGSGMHSLMAGSAATVTVRILKTSPTNSILQMMYNYQTSSSTTHGTNTIVVSDFGRGDLITLEQVAFKKQPTTTYAKEGGMVEWTFDAISSTTIYGVGTPEV
jgi:hypothetical protein